MWLHAMMSGPSRGTFSTPVARARQSTRADPLTIALRLS
jgi:hypothetical protein